MTTLQSIQQQPDATKSGSYYTDIQQDLDMVSLLLPFIALLAVVKATNFKGDDVKVNFMLRDTPDHPHQFEDITPYASAESKKTLSKTGDANSGIAGQLIFTKTEDWRQIKWSGAGSNGTLFEKKVSLTETSCS